MARAWVQTLRANGLDRVALTDWKLATAVMKDLEVDQYLAELNVCVDALGGRVNLVGLCQGGCTSAMYAARFPDKVASLVLVVRDTSATRRAGRSAVAVSGSDDSRVDPGPLMDKQAAGRNVRFELGVARLTGIDELAVGLDQGWKVLRPGGAARH